MAFQFVELEKEMKEAKKIQESDFNLDFEFTEEEILDLLVKRLKPFQSKNS